MERPYDADIFGREKMRGRVRRLNEAEVQYKQYCKVYARQHGISLEEAKKHRMCEEYKEYCEEVFGCRISEEEGVR